MLCGQYDPVAIARYRDGCGHWRSGRCGEGRCRVEQADKLERILARLNAARTVSDMDLPGYRLHPLKGELKGLYAVTVKANWRVIFRFNDGEAEDVDYLDYH